MLAAATHAHLVNAGKPVHPLPILLQELNHSQEGGPIVVSGTRVASASGHCALAKAIAIRWLRMVQQIYLRPGRTVEK